MPVTQAKCITAGALFATPAGYADPQHDYCSYLVIPTEALRHKDAMAPSAIDDPKQPRPDEKAYPPANIFPVKETRFEKYIEPQADGYKKAFEQHKGNAAIVIDNGK